MPNRMMRGNHSPGGTMQASDPNLYALGCALLSASGIHHSKTQIAGGGALGLSVLGLVAGLGGIVAVLVGFKLAGWVVLAGYLGGPLLYVLLPHAVRVQWSAMLLIGAPLVGVLLLFMSL